MATWLCTRLCGSAATEYQSLGGIRRVSSLARPDPPGVTKVREALADEVEVAISGGVLSSLALAKMWEVLDTNKDGKLDREEFSDLVRVF